MPSAAGDSNPSKELYEDASSGASKGYMIKMHRFLSARRRTGLSAFFRNRRRNAGGNPSAQNENDSGRNAPLQKPNRH